MNIQQQTAPSGIARKSQSGFSLVELMVAITISLLILVSLIAIYINLTRSNSELAKTNIQIENGRFATQFLQDEISHAGFWGSYVPQFDDLSSTATPAFTDAGGTVPTAIPDPCLAPADWNAEYKGNLLGIPIQADDGVPAGCAAVVTNKLANTDVLVIRHAETCLPGVGNCEADTTGKLYFQAAQCAAETSTPYVLDTAGFTLHKKDCTTLADKRKFISSIYYIRDYAVTAGDGIPTLVRSQFDLASDGTLKHITPPVALVDGIEAFRVEFGIDSLSDSGAATDYTHAVAWADPNNLNSPTNRGDGIPDGAFIRCTSSTPCTAAQMANAVAVKLYIVARSREATAGYTDNKTYTLGSTTWTPTSTAYKRHVFSTTVRLTNVSGRRETP